MNPSPTDLALIAAAIANHTEAEPEQKLPQALALWQASAKLLDSQHSNVTPPTQFAPAKIPFAQRLAELMPRLTASQCGKTFHDYQVNCIEKTNKAAGKLRSEESCEVTARNCEEVDRRDGVDPGAFADLPAWIQERTRLRRAEAGRMGGRAKSENRAAAKDNRKRKQRKPKLIFTDSAA